MTTSTTAPATADPMLEAHLRRLADNPSKVIITTPARRLPPRTRRHSVAHRSYR